MSRSKKKIRCKVWKFYPATYFVTKLELKVTKHDEQMWQWRYFGWAFGVFSYAGSFVAQLLGYGANFVVSMDKWDYDRVSRVDKIRMRDVVQ